MKREKPSTLAPDLLLLIAALAGIAINLLLLINPAPGTPAGTLSGIGGCGGGGCEEILNTRWSQAFHIPVTVFGLAINLAIILALTPPARRLLNPLLGILLGAAFWFTFIQAFILHRFCPLCLTAHAIALTCCLAGWFSSARHHGPGPTSRKFATWTLAGFLGIALIQIYGPDPATHRIVNLEKADSPVQQDIHAAGQGRKIRYDAVGKQYAVTSLPLIGNSEATHVFIEYFDYGCAACRITSGFIDALIARHPEDIAVIILPVPLDAGCNSALPPNAAQHPGSCDLARLSLAVWKNAPEHFPAYHHQLMLDPTVDNAKQRALALIPAEDFDNAIADPWIDRLIEANVRDWAAFSRRSDKLPKLLVPTGKIVHGAPSSQADFIQRLEQEIGL